MIKDAYGQTIGNFKVNVLRQQSPDATCFWETFIVEYESDMNVISVLQKIAALAKTSAGKATTPVAWDCGCLEEVCGSCTMVINGRVRQSCSALVDRLLEEQNEITLEPMSKFPVMRDLVVDRSRSMPAGSNDVGLELARFPRAALSRGVAGSRARTLIINLPGSTAGVRDGLAALVPVLPHAVAIVRDAPTDHSPGTGPPE